MRCTSILSFCHLLATIWIIDTYMYGLLFLFKFYESNFEFLHQSLNINYISCHYHSQLCETGFLDFATCGLFEADNPISSPIGTKGLKLLHCGKVAGESNRLMFFKRVYVC